MLLLAYSHSVSRLAVAQGHSNNQPLLVAMPQPKICCCHSSCCRPSYALGWYCCCCCCSAWHQFSCGLCCVYPCVVCCVHHLQPHLLSLLHHLVPTLLHLCFFFFSTVGWHLPLRPSIATSVADPVAATGPVLLQLLLLSLYVLTLLALLLLLLLSVYLQPWLLLTL